MPAWFYAAILKKGPVGLDDRLGVAPWSDSMPALRMDDRYNFQETRIA